MLQIQRSSRLLYNQCSCGRLSFTTWSSFMCIYKTNYYKCIRHLSQYEGPGSGRLKKSIFRFIIDTREQVNRSPVYLQPYLRLIRYDKPAGTFLIWYPGMWSLCLATPTTAVLPDPSLMLIFTAGAFFMRSAGCIINDFLDKDFDKSVERTRNRPLASGELMSQQALGCLTVCLSASAALLVQLNEYTMILGVISLLPVAIYPLLKRYTYFPQVGLGFTINWGALMASSAINGYCDWPVVLPLYLGCFCWTMYYDTIYGHQDKYDDIIVGVKSTALKFGEKTPTWLAIFAGSSITCWGISGIMAQQAAPYFVALTCFSIYYFYQLKTLDINNSTNCWNKFNSQKYAGILLLLGGLLGTYFRNHNTSAPDKNQCAKKAS